MSLLRNAGPPRPVTHQRIDPLKLKDIAERLENFLDGQPTTPALMRQFSEEEGVVLSHAYAGLAVAPQIMPPIDSETLIAICVGDCQEQGALENLEELLELKDGLDQKGSPSFSIVPRHCLDMCAHSPVCISRSPHGQAAHPRLKKESLQEMVSQLCETDG